MKKCVEEVKRILMKECSGKRMAVPCGLEVDKEEDGEDDVGGEVQVKERLRGK